MRQPEGSLPTSCEPTHPRPKRRKRSPAPPRRPTAATLIVSAGIAAEILYISRRTLYSLSWPRGPIPVIKVGPRAIRYHINDLKDYVDGQRRGAGIMNPPREDPDDRGEKGAEVRAAPSPGGQP